MAAVEDLQRHRLQQDQRQQDHQQAAAEQGARQEPLRPAGRAGDRSACARQVARLQHVAAAAHRVQEARLARVGLDLAAQPRHLHVDRALAGLVHAERGGDLLARQHLVGLAGQRGQQARASPPVRRTTPSGPRSSPRSGRSSARRACTGPAGGSGAGGGRAAQQGADAQHQLARLERLAAGSRRRRPRSRRCGPPARRARSAAAPADRGLVRWRSDSVSVEPAFARHHHVEHHQVGVDGSAAWSRASAALSAVVTRKPSRRGSATAARAAGRRRPPPGCARRRPSRRPLALWPGRRPCVVVDIGARARRP